ncbi:MAG: 16S rRNA (uracil(1498)-N(3))-methyltransferase [Pseudomonadota bacterium]
MPTHDFRTQRLFVEASLAEGREVTLDKPQSHYLTNVLRMEAGAPLLLFNGRDGEWRATIARAHKTATVLALIDQARPQTPPSPITYAFAPLKSARLDYMVQKAVEMGAGRLQPVLTHHTQVTRVNVERMRANVREAAEQCGLLGLADVAQPVSLEALLIAREGNGGEADHLLMCDERAEAPALMLLQGLSPGPATLLVGPEGGFSGDERERLVVAGAVRLSLGPRILRADTAAVAGLALLQAVLGDGREG